MHRRRRRIGVPRGMLRQLSLQFMKQRPMSGSEIADQIEEYTDWRPSPGSIYPLLSFLQEEGLIQPHDDKDTILKRFALTERGREIIMESVANDRGMKNRYKSIRKVYWKLHMEMPEELYNSLSNMLNTFESAYIRNRDPERIQRLGAALDSAANIIKEIDAK
ncbi:MAG TPA: PadR family transcriptional regulator [Patescibacteria group bacterium]|nr:PadR family transcriptional regulator [Patescibacteria group bacterium]